MDDEIKKRVRWAIERVCEDRRLTNKTLAPLLKSTATTLSNYRTMKNLPKAGFFVKFCDYFNYDKDWFFHGEGEPFPGARAKYHEVCGPETPPPAPLYNKDTLPPIGAGELQKINIDEAWGKTYKILKSETPYAVALYLNIQQFSSALDATTELKICQDRITNLETQVSDLRRQMDRLTAPSTTADQQKVG